MTIEFGLILAPGPLKGAIDDWMNDLDAVLPILEGHMHSVWMPDHFFWGNMPTYEAMTVLTYLAAKFPIFHYGTGVLGQTYRNPALLAKMAATLQVISGGRFILGIGAGWKEDEHRAYNFPYPPIKARIEQLEETLQILQLLWRTPGPVSFSGKHYQIHDAYCEPLPTPPPLIVVGGQGRTTMKHAARYADWWNISDVSAETVAERMTILREHCRAIGRDFSTIRKTWYGRLALGNTQAEAIERAKTQGRDHYAGWVVENALVGTPEQVLEQIRAYTATGIDFFHVDILNINQPDVQHLLVDQLLPAVARLTES